MLKVRRGVVAELDSGWQGLGFRGFVLSALNDSGRVHRRYALLQRSRRFRSPFRVVGHPHRLARVGVRWAGVWTTRAGTSRPG